MPAYAVDVDRGQVFQMQCARRKLRVPGSGHGSSKDVVRRRLTRRMRPHAKTVEKPRICGDSHCETTVLCSVRHDESPDLDECDQVAATGHVAVGQRRQSDAALMP